MELDAAREALPVSDRGPPVKVVHGFPLLSRPPHGRFGHAWVEVGDVVYDRTVSTEPLPKDFYYTRGHITVRDRRLYEPWKAMARAVKANTWGPWDDPQVVYDFVGFTHNLAEARGA